jgi:hypothetical protein
MAAPPLFIGAENDTLTDDDPVADPETLVGAPGTEIIVVVPAKEENGPYPRIVLACIAKL